MGVCVNILLHHGGNLVDNGSPSYTGGECEVIPELDINKLSVVVLRSFTRNCGYTDQSAQLLYKAEGSNVFEDIVDDDMLLGLTKELLSGQDVHIFVVDRRQHVHQPSIIEDWTVNEGGQPNIIEDWTVNEGGQPSIIEDLTVNQKAKGKRAVDADPDQSEIDIEQEEEHNSKDSSSEFEDDDEFRGVPTAVQEAIDNQQSDVDEELLQVRATINQLRKPTAPRKKKRADSSHIPLGLAGIDPGFEDLYNDKSKYANLIGGDEDYYGSSDPGSFSSGDSDDGSDEEVVRSRRSHNRRVCYDSNVQIVQFQLGLVFENVKEFREAVRKYQIQRQVNVTLDPNEKYRVRGKCKDEMCSWEIYASIDKKTTNFVIKKYNPVHDCETSNKIKTMNSKFISKHYKKTIIRFPAIRIWQIQEMIKDDFTLHVGKTVCRRAKIKVIAEHMGDYKEEFSRLFDYRDQLLSTNQGSTVVVKVSRDLGETGNHKFVGFYVCFKALRDGFLEGCRRCIGVDGCFLRGIVKGQILVAVAKDGNHQMFPIAWAIVSQETTETWTWFLSILKEDLGMEDGSRWTIVSDMQKGLSNAVEQLLPEIEHRMCARHILANWSKKWKGVERRKKFWACARSTFEIGLKDNLKKLEDLGDGAVPDLLYYNVESWCRTYFKTYTKCDVVDNNMSETFNGWILSARHKTIITMLEEIRVQVMNRIHQLREFAGTWISDISPMAMKVLMDNTKIAMTCCKIEWNGDSGFQVVQGEYGHVVDLRMQTCSCKAWELKGIPCPHAICAMNHIKVDPQDYIAHWFHKGTHIKAYSHFIQPVMNMKMWPQIDNQSIEPPVVKKMPGRPKTKRRREHDEPKHGKLSRRGLQMTCTVCKAVGHNKAKCSSREEQIQGDGNASNSGHRARGRGGKRGRPKGSRSKYTPVRMEGGEGESSQPSQTRPRLSGYGIYINENNGWTCSNGDGNASNSGNRARGRGGKRGRPKGSRSKYTPVRMEGGEGESSQPSQTRPRLSGYGIYINENNGWTCSNIGRPTQRVVSTSSSTVKNSANVTGDLGYKPNGLKWKGKASISTNTLLQEKVDTQRRHQARATQSIPPPTAPSQTTRAIMQPIRTPNASTQQERTPSATTQPISSRPPIAPRQTTVNKKRSSPANVVQWKY